MIGKILKKRSRKFIRRVIYIVYIRGVHKIVASSEDDVKGCRYRDNLLIENKCIFIE